MRDNRVANNHVRDLSQSARSPLVARTHRLIAAGFDGNRAYALADAGYDVIDWWPFGWLTGGPSLFFSPGCNSTAVLSSDGAS